MKNKQVLKLSTSAIIVALSFVLSKIQIIPMPFGGSVTLFSMLSISLAGYFLGLKYGFISSIIFSLLKLIYGGDLYTPLQAIIDYVFSFSVFGITGFFHNKNDKKYLILTYSLAVVFRFIFACISGYVFFAEYTPEGWNALIYVIVYNGGYIFTEAILSIIIIFIPAFYKTLESIKRKLQN